MQKKKWIQENEQVLGCRGGDGYRGMNRHGGQRRGWIQGWLDLQDEQVQRQITGQLQKNEWVQGVE